MTHSVHVHEAQTHPVHTDDDCIFSLLLDFSFFRFLIQYQCALRMFRPGFIKTDLILICHNEEFVCKDQNNLLLYYAASSGCGSNCV